MSEYNGKEPLPPPNERMAYWINNRWIIYVKKERGDPPPWTSDRILQNFRFCNVHRENDKVTQWIANHWRNPNSSHPNLVAAMVLARMFNLPTHLTELQPFIEWDLDDMCRVSKERRERGDKCFNGAYLITTCGVKMDKIDYVYRVVEDVAKDRVFKVPCYVPLKDFHLRLTQTKGLGDFLAGQIIADLKNTPGHPLQKAVDHSTWATPGPGSLRGLARLEGAHRPSRAGFLGRMHAARATVTPLLIKMPTIDAQDFQNCLCEFDKWDRTYLGTSRPKQRYPGNSNN